MEMQSCQVSRRLHEEHLATIALWARVEASLAAGRLDAPLLRSAAAALAEELARHFEFEEKALFPRLADAGEGDLAELLREEHETIRAAARQFIAAVGEEPVGARARTLGLEIAERLPSHARKEEMSMLPALDNLLDESTDAELIMGYVA